MPQNPISVITEKMSTLSKSHKRIGNYILENSDKAMGMTATRLGEVTGVSESTVVRFANELGYKGYPELQRALKNLVKNRLTSVQRIGVSDSTIGEDVLGAVMLNDIDNLKTSLEQLDKEQFETASQMIASAKSIYIVGVRSSSMLANFLYYYLDLIMDNVHLVLTAGAGEIYEQLRRIGTDDVIIGITFPRYSARTVDCLKFAHKSGASIVAITDNEVSPVSSVADSVLYVKSDMASFVDSLVGPLSVINALIVSVGRKKKDSLENTFKRLEEIWEEFEVYEKSKN